MRSFISPVPATEIEDGRRSGFNDRGQLAFWAQFTDGTEGVFVTNLVAVPEPSGCYLLALGLLLAGVIGVRRNRAQRNG